MRQRDLEILLERVPPHPDPKPDLEQYRTPPIIAADVLVRALALGDIRDRRILDIGTGTGMFAIGAALLGAAEATGIDVDADAIRVAKETAAGLGADTAAFEVQPVEKVTGTWDVVLQNPPFGAQTRHADRPFLAKALEVAAVVYTIHLTETGDWVIREAARHGAALTHAWDYAFPIPHQFRFHTQAVKRVPVTVFRFEKA